MRKTLAEMFQASEGRSVEVGGVVYSSIYKAWLASGVHQFTMKLEGSNSNVVQGVRISVRKGSAVINGITSCHFVIWGDSSPPSVPMRIHSEGGGLLSVWNVWRTRIGEQAWVGDAGMVIEERSGVVTFNCSDGSEGIDLENLRFCLIRESIASGKGRRSGSTWL